MLRRFRWLAIPLAFVFLVVGCQQSPRYAHVSPGQVRSVDTHTELSQDKFDLQTVAGLLKTRQVTDADSLMQIINAPNSPINNVDLDGDEKIDFVSVNETGIGSTHTFHFAAEPASRNGDPVPIASIDVTDQGQQVFVGAQYAGDPVGYYPYQYYVPRASLGDALFLAWMLTPSRSYYYHAPYAYYPGWSSRRVMPMSQVTTMRTSYSTQMRVSPIQRAAPPAGYTGKIATKMPSSLASKPMGSGLSGTAGQMRDYKVNNKPASTGTAFGATSKPSAPASSSWGGSSAAKPSSSWGSAPAAKPSSSWGSAPASRPSSSWGGSSAAKPSSSWGGSSSGRSSFGGGSSRSSSGGGGRR